MNYDTVTVVFYITKRDFKVDIEVPLNITANELVQALNIGYDLGIDMSDVKHCYLKSEKPIALLKGNKTLSEVGLRNGSIIYFTE